MAIEPSLLLPGIPDLCNLRIRPSSFDTAVPIQCAHRRARDLATPLNCCGAASVSLF